MRQFLAFVGIDDVEFVHAEGLALGEASASAALAAARETIESIAAPAALALAA